MRIRCDVVCETGKVRDNNEDMALVFGEQVRDSALSFTCDVEDTTRFVAAVADGMGGHADGEVASAMATGSFNDFLAALPDGLDAEEVVKAVKQWGVDVSEWMRTAAQGSGMGCTFCGMFTYGGNVYVLNAGDSRLYRLRYGLFKQLTIDHSERVRQNDPAIPSNLIYNALGLDNVFVDVTPTRMVNGDKYLICSDGLTDMVEGAEIGRQIRVEDCSARRLVEAALAAGGADNVTVVLLEVGDE